MLTLQYAALGLFLLFAALTLLHQFRFGMDSGRISRTLAQDELDQLQKQRAGRRSQGVLFAVLAGLSLAACIVIGAVRSNM